MRIAMLLVRNGVSYDARVLRAARAAGPAVGGKAIVVGVATERDPPGAGEIDGIEVRRFPPWGRAELLRRVLRSPARNGKPGGRPPAGRVSARRVERGRGGLSSSRRALTRLRRIAVGFAFGIQAIALARRLRPVLVHANDWNTMWAALAIKLICGSALVYDSHELWADRNGRWESRWWLVASEAVFVRAADEVITTSPGYARVLAARYRVPEPSVIRNIPAATASVVPSAGREPVLAYVGGLMRGRGLELVIESLPLVGDATLRVIGPGPASYRASLAQRAQEAGTLERLELVGPVPPAEVQAALAGSELGLCLIEPICRSYELSLPNKLFEYAAAGLPIIATDLPVIGSLVEEQGLGEVVRTLDPPAVAAAIRRLLDPDARAEVICRLRRFAAANSWEREAELLGGVYRQAAGRVT